MAKNNFVFERGTLAQPPYFDYIPNQRRDGVDPFLQFLLDVERDASQPRAFPSDRIRIVSYGALAERTYPTLQVGGSVNVIGWLQYRAKRRVLEVVADEIRTEGAQSIGNEDAMRLLDKAAALLAMEVSDVLELILMPQLKAILKGGHPLLEGRANHGS